MYHSLKLLTGNSNPELAEQMADYLDVRLTKTEVKRFSDGEIAVEIGENVRGSDAFVIQSICSPVNENLMELLLLLDALRRSSARRITAVIPYYGYARQDRKVAPRVPISAKLVANLINTAGASRVLSMDLHAGQIQGFFDIPVDHLYAAPILLDYLKHNLGNDLVVVSPDAGGTERARAFAKRLEAGLAIVDKRREAPNVAKAMNIIGNIQGKTTIILDDMVDTAGTLTQAADALKKAGAKQVCACVTHPVLSGPALERIAQSAIESLVVTNTIPLSEEAKASDKITALPVANLLGEAIRRIHNEDSVSSLFV
ncbi:MAG: ribose-phosphate pyrophosphokinase [Deltaproteobacteria bacterium]|nr:ribose-phosphate pyrophosphokinase [Deltaproteobacteria bacterium]